MALIYAHAALSGRNTHYLPGMIDFLQEPILEPGLLFHFGLSKMVQEDGIDTLIGGDCNDQVYDTNLYHLMGKHNREPMRIEEYPMYGRLRLGEFDRMYTFKYFTDIEINRLLKSMPTDGIILMHF